MIGTNYFSLPAWPVDFTVDDLTNEFLRLLMKPPVSEGSLHLVWPEGAPNCLMMTQRRRNRPAADFTAQLMDWTILRD